LLKDLLVWFQSESCTTALSTARFADGTEEPQQSATFLAFRAEPWPCWKWRTSDGHEIEVECFLAHEGGALCWSARRTRGRGPAWVHIRPLLGGSQHHALTRANEDVVTQVAGQHGFTASWRRSGAQLSLSSNAPHAHEPRWWFDFHLPEESQRGHDCVEDLLQPGVFSGDLLQGPVHLIATATGEALPSAEAVEVAARHLRSTESRRRKALGGSLSRAADQYLVRRGSQRTIIAGYPWFGDYGRDTMLALRGLLHATGRIDAARDVLLAWAGLVDENGGLPNTFAESGGSRLTNSADAPLWFALVVAEHAQHKLAKRPRGEMQVLRASALRILQSILEGRHELLRLDADGLLAHGSIDTQLTWMDAMVQGQPVTPRAGKAVEIQALWLNALALWASDLKGAHRVLARGKKNFKKRFVLPEATYLADVVDVNHEQGRVDASLRPNQIFALGALPLTLVPGRMARIMLEHVEMALLTEAGLRTLDLGTAEYRGQCVGDAAARDGAYHQGTVWPWLMAPFVEAWVRQRGNTASVRREARAKFMDPFLQHMGQPGVGHMAEIADGDAPHAPRGAPFQAWSLGAVLDLQCHILA
jgi:predicted glycogen debranching enzyme